MYDIYINKQGAYASLLFAQCPSAIDIWYLIYQKRYINATYLLLRENLRKKTKIIIKRS